MSRGKHLAPQSHGSRLKSLKPLLLFALLIDTTNYETTRTPLLVAATAGHVKAVEELINGKADINAVGDNGETALIVACASSQKDVAKLLIKKGADVTVVHKRGGSALIEASGEGWNDVVSDIIKKKVDVNLQDENGFDALMVAAAAGKADVVNSLLKAGAKTDTLNNAKGNAMHEACAIGNKQIVEALLKAKADPDVANESGHTCLMMAATNGYEKDPKEAMEIVKLLAGKGANLEASGEDKRTTLFMAAMTGNPEIIELLIKLKADINGADKNKFTPLMAAAASGQYEVVEALIKAGAEVDAKHEKGGTALHAASSAGQRTIVEALVNGTFAKTADIHSVDEDDDTPLHLAVMRLLSPVRSPVLSHLSWIVHACFIFVRFTVRCASIWHRMCPNHISLLSWMEYSIYLKAWRRGHYDTIIPLLKNGANFDTKNKKDKSPMSLAEEYKEQVSICPPIRGLEG